MVEAMIAPAHPPTNTVDCRNWHIQYLAERMRDDEIEQYKVLTFAEHYDPEVAARGFMSTPGVKFALMGADGWPVCAGGYEEVMPGIWQSWMLGTLDGWGDNWRAITKTTRWAMQGLFEMGARRLQTNVLASRHRAIAWYERSLGLKHEGTWRGYGRNGEDVACFARLRED